MGKHMKIYHAAPIAAGLMTAGPALAHHSFAMFDSDKTVTIQGTVKEFQWTNPHCWVQLDVMNAAGGSDEWSIEGGSPNSLGRQGWKAASLKPGDSVAITIHPLKNGAKGGALMSVKLPNGTVLGQSQGSAAPPPPEDLK
jgi:hypothetical protein